MQASSTRGLRGPAAPNVVLERSRNRASSLHSQMIPLQNPAVVPPKKTKQTVFKQGTLPGAADDLDPDAPEAVVGAAAKAKAKKSWVWSQFAADGKQCLHCPFTSAASLRASGFPVCQLQPLAHLSLYSRD